MESLQLENNQPIVSFRTKEVRQGTCCTVMWTDRPLCLQRENYIMKILASEVHVPSLLCQLWILLSSSVWTIPFEPIFLTCRGTIVFLPCQANTSLDFSILV